MYEDNVEYARQRLENTVIRTLEGEAVYVNGVRQAGKKLVFDVLKLLSGEELKLSSDKLLFESPPLGYVNSPNGAALYMVRVPRRNDWRQGIRRENIKCFSNETHAAPDFFQINYKNIAKTIQNIYPTLDVALKSIDKIVPVIGFCRDFAVGLEEKVFYKGYEVGLIDKLKPRFQYLKEYFEEVKNG